MIEVRMTVREEIASRLDWRVSRNAAVLGLRFFFVVSGSFDPSFRHFSWPEKKNLSYQGGEARTVEIGFGWLIFMGDQNKIFEKGGTG
jgi:hypothetical protein